MPSKYYFDSNQALLLADTLVGLIDDTPSAVIANQMPDIIEKFSRVSNRPSVKAICVQLGNWNERLRADRLATSSLERDHFQADCQRLKDWFFTLTIDVYLIALEDMSLNRFENLFKDAGKQLPDPVRTW